MADALPAGEFWLPPKLFTDDDDDEPPHPKQKPQTPNFDFPAFSGSDGSSLSSPAFSSPVGSVLGSTETDSDEEDESLAELTRSFTRLGLRANQSQGSWTLTTSPQSTVTGAEIWGRRKSSPAAVGGGCSWDPLQGEVAGLVSRMKMNGGDEGVLKSGGHVGPPMGGAHHGQPRWLPLTRNFYGHQFPFNHFEPEKHDQFLNPSNCCAILGRPSMDDLLRRQIQLQQHMISLHRSNLLQQIQFGEKASKCSSLGLPQYGGPSPPLQHPSNQMRGASLTSFGPKQTCVGTGVFIPRPYPSSVPNKPDRSKTIPIQKIPSFQVDGLAKHGKCLPQEWSY